MHGGSGLTWTAIPVPSTVPHGLPVANTQALVSPHGPGCCSRQLGLEGPQALYLASAGS